MPTPRQACKPARRGKGASKRKAQRKGTRRAAIAAARPDAPAPELTKKGRKRARAEAAAQDTVAPPPPKAFPVATPRVKKSKGKFIVVPCTLCGDDINEGDKTHRTCSHQHEQCGNSNRVLQRMGRGEIREQVEECFIVLLFGCFCFYYHYL